jgi:galactonate dehydratase
MIVNNKKSLTMIPKDKGSNNRRKFLKNTIASVAAASVGVASLGASNSKSNFKSGPIDPNDKIKITKVETFVLKSSWVFIKISTDAGITGWGEMLKDDAKACAAGAMEVADYLIGKDPRPVAHHWQAIHRGAFYRGGPIKTAISSGIDQALWDITGKCFGVPVHKLLGGPTRDKVLVYGTEPDYKVGLKAIKVGPKASRSPF